MLGGGSINSVSAVDGRGVSTPADNHEDGNDKPKKMNRVKVFGDCVAQPRQQDKQSQEHDKARKQGKPAGAGTGIDKKETGQGKPNTCKGLCRPAFGGDEEVESDGEHHGCPAAGKVFIGKCAARDGALLEIAGDLVDKIGGWGPAGDKLRGKIENIPQEPEEGLQPKEKPALLDCLIEDFAVPAMKLSDA